MVILKLNGSILALFSHRSILHTSFDRSLSWKEGLDPIMLNFPVSHISWLLDRLRGRKEEKNQSMSPPPSTPWATSSWWTQVFLCSPLQFCFVPCHPSPWVREKTSLPFVLPAQGQQRIPTLAILGVALFVFSSFHHCITDSLHCIPPVLNTQVVSDLQVDPD